MVGGMVGMVLHYSSDSLYKKGIYNDSKCSQTEHLESL